MRVVVEGALALRAFCRGRSDPAITAGKFATRGRGRRNDGRGVDGGAAHFITPFDRTDIKDLIGSLDDAIDQMNKTAKAIALFEVRSFEPQMQQMGESSCRRRNWR